MHTSVKQVFYCVLILLESDFYVTKSLEVNIYLFLNKSIK